MNSAPPLSLGCAADRAFPVRSQDSSLLPWDDDIIREQVERDWLAFQRAMESDWRL